jgi:uncharacterized protein YdcH (DUF465 family)
LEPEQPEALAVDISRQKTIFDRNMAKKNKIENMITKLAEAATTASTQLTSSPATDKLSNTMESVANTYISRAMEEHQMRMAERKQQEDERISRAAQANMDNMMKMCMQQMQMRMMQQMMSGIFQSNEKNKDVTHPVEINVFSPPRPKLPVGRQEETPMDISNETDSLASDIAKTMSTLFNNGRQ